MICFASVAGSIPAACAYCNNYSGLPAISAIKFSPANNFALASAICLKALIQASAAAYAALIFSSARAE
jgi:hypothetical protein